MTAIRIDPEFQKKIPLLTEDEFSQLEENILLDGEVYEPLNIWNGIIVDGHNRWKIILKHPEIIYHVREMDFADKWAAFDWMFKKQLGRRNLSGEQRTLLIGQMYLMRKKHVGAPYENSNAKKQFPQNGEIVSDRNDTEESVAKEVGVGSTTVERAAKYAKGIEALRSVSDEAATKILKGGSGVRRKTVMEFPNLEQSDLTKIANAIVAGEELPIITKDTPPSPTSPTQKREKHESAIIPSEDGALAPSFWGSQKGARLDPEIERINAEARDLNRVTEYTLEDMLMEMREISRTFTSQIKRVLTIRSYILNEPVARAEVTDFLDESIASLDALKGLVAPFNS